VSRSEFPSTSHALRLADRRRCDVRMDEASRCDSLCLRIRMVPFTRCQFLPAYVLAAFSLTFLLLKSSGAYALAILGIFCLYLVRSQKRPWPMILIPASPPLDGVPFFNRFGKSCWTVDLLLPFGIRFTSERRDLTNLGSCGWSDWLNGQTKDATTYGREQ